MKKLITAALICFTVLFAPFTVSADVSRVSPIGTKASISTGYYYLIPVKLSSGKALSIMDHSTSRYATTCIYTKQNKRAQQFYINASLGGTYVIKNRASTYALSVKNASKASGAEVRQNTWQKVNSQRWYFIKVGSYYRIQSSISKNLLTVIGDNSSSGASVRTCYRNSNFKGQYWKLVPVSSSTSGTTSTSNDSPKYKTSSRTGMTDNDYKILNNIIGAVETGGQVYGQRNYADYTPPYSCSANEHTCTLGWGAFYGDEAQYLISTIRKRDPSTFKKINTKGLIAAALEKNWVKTKWNPNETEKQLLIKLITTDTGKKVQDEMFKTLMMTYVSACKSTYTSNTWAIMMYSEIRHLGGSSGAKRIFDKCKSKGSYSLDTIMNALKEDQADTSSNYQVGDSVFWSRHEKCAEFIQKYA